MSFLPSPARGGRSGSGVRMLIGPHPNPPPHAGEGADECREIRTEDEGVVGVRRGLRRYAMAMGFRGPNSRRCRSARQGCRPRDRPASPSHRRWCGDLVRSDRAIQWDAAIVCRRPVSIRSDRRCRRPRSARWIHRAKVRWNPGCRRRSRTGERRATRAPNTRQRACCCRAERSSAEVSPEMGLYVGGPSGPSLDPVDEKARA